MNDIIEKAKELGQLIAESEELRAMQACEERQSADPDAARLLEEYQQKRADITSRMKGEEMTPEALKGFQAEIQAAMDTLTANQAVREYLEAKARFSQLMMQVNSVISFCVKGEEAEGDCSGNCGSCGGCGQA